jgi:hypothetical protein
LGILGRTAVNAGSDEVTMLNRKATIKLAFTMQFLLPHSVLGGDLGN